MPRYIKKISKQAGLAPGTLVHIGERKTEKAKITVIDYDNENLQEKVVGSVEECFPFKDSSTVTWINIDGIHDVSLVEKIGKEFGLHPLVLADIMNTGQRPRMEEFDDYIYVSLKMLYFDKKNEDMIIEQVSLVLGKNYVISFQEQEGDVFEPVRERIRQSKGRVRKMGPDYLAYSLIDAVVDNYFVILESFGEDLEHVEEMLAKNPEPKVMNTIHKLKRDTILLRKSIWPLREIVGGIQRGGSSLVTPDTGPYYRDIYDHTVQVMETIEAMRDMVSGLLDIYLSSISNRMNEVMKVLTIFAAIFIPLTFIAGIYGMNFNPEMSPWNMPELNWKFGYFFALGIMILVAGVMLIYFKKKRWL